MIKRIVGVFKTIGDGLYFENSGELLSDERKQEVLSKTTADFSHSLASFPVRVLLVSDETFTPSAVAHGIQLCDDSNAMLELMYINNEDAASSLQLASILPLLEKEPNLDFQVTRRQGELMDVLKTYIISRKDILMVLLCISESMRKRMDEYLHLQSDIPVSNCPPVKLVK